MRPVQTDIRFPHLEESILSYWEENGIAEKGLAANQGQEPFIFYDGPPFATGLPHYGHILPGTLKDVVPRYWVMKGRYVERRWGWDCHGLPVEFELEKELGLKGLHEVEAFGIDKFNEACRGIVQRYTKEWERTIHRTGRWVDFKNAYRTMDTPFMETIWWITRQLWDKGLIYEGYRVMPYSWRIATPLSNFEASQNYREVQDPAITVKFRSLKSQRYLLAWTTTPWTLPSNLALAVNESLTYVEIEDLASKERYVLVKERLAHYFPDAAKYRLVSEFEGRALLGERYEPLFPFFKEYEKEGAFQVFAGHHVTASDGTGIVHTNPAHGEDDALVCQNNGLKTVIDTFDREGNFNALVTDYVGQNFKEADKQIIKDLKAQGLLLRHDTYTHNYAHCWRSDTPLMNRAISTWFVKLDPIKEALIRNNAKTHWVPEHLRDGRFGNWLENARDWNISRNRFWGTPIPIWRGEDGEMYCVESIDELHKLSGQRPDDLHKHFIDSIEIKSPKTGKTLKRIPEVFDCWFESGSMPYAQQHYPFKDVKRFDQHYPADFIAEGVDQTRGWFYTLSVLSTALFDKAPFKNVIVNGLVLAEDGKKMSKRLKNYPEPETILNQYGADALRAYLMNSPASHAEELRFSETGVAEVVRSVLLPYWNAYSFFVTYARADGWEPSKFDEQSLDRLENDLDRWVVSRLQSLVETVDQKMAIYHLYEVVPKVIGFIDELTNWYIRLNRRRFWSEDKTDDKKQAYTTLYFVLTNFCKVMAPILPFITEEIFRNLTEDRVESVHLERFPEVRSAWVDRELEHQMQLVQTVVSMGRTCRNNNKLKTRQPLREIKIITRNPDDRKTIERNQELIAAELNVRNVSFSADESQWVTYTAKPNAKILGPKLGQKMKPVMARIRSLTPEEIAAFDKAGQMEIEGITVLSSEILIDRQPKQEGAIQTTGGVTVWLDSKLDDHLIAEGRARELVNRIQKLRKDTGLQVTDRIRVRYGCPEELHEAFTKHLDYISAETLSEALEYLPTEKQGDQEIDGHPLALHIEKI